jgi:hypothetical protein
MRWPLHLEILSCIMAVIFPAALFAAEPNPGAMLYARGETMLNGSSVPRSSALFSGDLVETRADSVANISATGSTVLVLNDSLIQYEGNTVKLEHGGVTISTSKSLATRVGTLNVSPAAGVLTEFEVRDIDGTVRIAARKGDLSISDDSGTTLLAQGQETTRDEPEAQKDKKRKRRVVPGAVPSAAGGMLDSPWAIGIGGGAIIGVTAWVLTKGDEPASPAKP